MAKKSVGWSKSENEEKIDKPKEENPSQEKNMDEKQILGLLDKREQKLIETLNEKYGGNAPPGGDKMDQDTKDYLDKIGQSMEKQGKILEGLFSEKQQKENEKRFGELIEERIKPVKDAYGGLSKKIGRVEKLVCNEDGTVCFSTKEELENWKKDQVKELEKAKGKAKKTSEEKPDLSQLSGQDLWNQIKKNETYVKDVGEIHIKKVLEDPDYRAEILDTLCDPKNEQCRVDVMEKFNKFSEQKEKAEKEKKIPEGKKFFLVK